MQNWGYLLLGLHGHNFVFCSVYIRSQEKKFEPRISGFLARRSTTWAILVHVASHAQISLLRRVPIFLVQIFLLRSYNVNFPRHKLWVCFQLIIWFEYHIHVKGEVSSLVVNKMADSVMTTPPGKSGIHLKREILTWAGMKTRMAQVVEGRARNPDIRGSNPGSGSNFSIEIS